MEQQKKQTHYEKYKETIKKNVYRIAKENVEKKKVEKAFELVRQIYKENPNYVLSELIKN